MTSHCGWSVHRAEADQIISLQETLRFDSGSLKKPHSMLPDETTIHFACLVREPICYKISEAG
jgi:hypothetical protein